MSEDRERARWGSSNEDLVAFMLSLRSPASAVTEVLSAARPMPERRRPPRFQWLCRRGRHSWQVLSVTHIKRVVLAGGRELATGTVTECCRRCGFGWTRYKALLPKRVRT